MKRKILLYLASFVVMCMAVGIISIVKKPITNADTDTSRQEVIVPDELTANEITPPDCGGAEETLADCFPISLPGIENEENKAGNLPTVLKKSAIETPVKNSPETVSPNEPHDSDNDVVSSGGDVKISPRLIKWGAYLPSGQPSAVTAFESQVGATMDIRAVFVGWDSPNGDFPSWLSASLLSANKTLLIFWEPSDGNTDIVNQPAYNFDAIIAGNWDSYISSFAQDVKSYGGPVILVPFEEMNGDWYPWSGTLNNNSPAKEITAWRHMHDIFTNANVTNVRWGFAPNNDSWPNTTANDLMVYYPGNAYVDIVGVDGFNFNQPNNPWQTFSQIFNNGLAKSLQFNKPIYIFSMASAEKNDGGIEKATWITDTLVHKIPNIQRIAGWIWFDENKEEDWRVDSTPASLQAFSSAVQIY